MRLWLQPAVDEKARNPLRSGRLAQQLVQELLLLLHLQPSAVAAGVTAATATAVHPKLRLSPSRSRSPPGQPLGGC